MAQKARVLTNIIGFFALSFSLSMRRNKHVRVGDGFYGPAFIAQNEFR